MNREIKFRAWDKKKNIMINEINPCYLNSTDLIIMQFTGLQDKNGVDIYEGDIVFHVLTKQKTPVIFEKGCFYTKFSDQYYRLGNWKDGAIEVIGNIHENKDLLQ